MTDNQRSTILSFAETPIAEISAKGAELESLGWIFDEERRGDPWLVLVSKRFPAAPPDDCEAELRNIMGT